MNTGPLKSYAVQARKDFIQAVTDRAAQLGIAKDSIAPVQASSGSDKGVVVIAGAPFPASVVHARELVVTAIARDGFRAVIEQVAYTWFNRLVALRFMEVHGYFDHGLRVLSDPNGGAVPEVVARLRDLDLPTLDKSKAVELAMAGNQDEALYRLILLAQCQHLSKPMPWLFDTRLHDGVDLLLPENLLATDSLVRGLVNDIPEEDWKQGVEIIGWLYQFFISERKDEVIGSVVAPEDIPAATQLFTPNWIVQYLVQNSVGRLWMESYPNSTLRQHMPYYIEPAAQDPEVQAALDKLVVRDRTPESLTVLDPACGSGHILVEAFRLLFRIYLERGYRERDIPRLIFAHNLFGLDIDDRAAQLACMTLLFEARRHDARIFLDPPQLQMVTMQQSRESDIAVIDGSSFSAKAEAKELVHLFREAKTFGSLLRMPKELQASLGKIHAALPKAQQQQSFLSQGISEIIQPLVTQAQILSRQYQAVVANPPYMGGKGMNKNLKEFAKNEYPDSKADAFAMFIERGFELAHERGFNAMVTMQSWMFLSSYEKMRERLFLQHTIHCLAHFPYDGKGPTAMGISFGISAFSIRNGHHTDYKGDYCCARYYELNSEGKPTVFPIKNERLKSVRQSDLTSIPGSPAAYWIDDVTRKHFCADVLLGSVGNTCQGLSTSDNDKFVRGWHEVSTMHLCLPSGNQDKRNVWHPFNKGGEERRWYGNNDLVVLWDNNGSSIKSLKPKSVIRNELFYFRPGITWSALSSARFSARYFPDSFIFADKGQSFFTVDEDTLYTALAILNSKIGWHFISTLCPTLDFHSGYIARVPFRSCPAVIEHVKQCILLAKSEWDSHETSWDFTGHPLTQYPTGIPDAVDQVTAFYDSIETELLFAERNIDIELSKEFRLFEMVDDSAIKKLNIRALQSRLIIELISYFVGCMMGRYSLDCKMITYAHVGNLDFNPSKYPTFPADADGIIPLTDEAWFKDDAAERFVEFVSKAWPVEGLEENLAFIASNLEAKVNEVPLDAIRRYFANDFYQDHCQTYKKRPIYWLFSSGKQKAFQCLVYLHRYNGDTLGRMRADYVIPLQGKLQGRQTALTEEVTRAGSTAQRKQAQKALDLIDKKIRELAAFDDQLRTYADQRIEIDLDDGVKVNIRKFGALIDLGPLGGADE